MQVNGVARPTQLKLAVSGHAKFVICDYAIERTIAWFGRYRRLSKDYEKLTESSEAMIYLASIHIMLKRTPAPT